jgi:hypothetical protein
MRRHFESIRFQSGASKAGACDGQSVANWDGTSGKWTHTVHRSGHRTPNLGIPVIYGVGGCQELYYWATTVQGRGEFVRLAMEQGGAQYRDVARESGKGAGIAAMMRLLNDLETPPFAPPVLRAGRLLIG